MTLNERQKRFCEHYASSGNGAQAARDAGYSERTARTIANELLTKPDIQEYVRRLQDQAAAVRIASMNDVKAYWSDVLNDPQAKTADRLRAGELLAKAAGAFLHSRPDVDDGGAGYLAGEHDGEDIVIYLPDNGRDTHLQRGPELHEEAVAWASSR